MIIMDHLKLGGKMFKKITTGLILLIFISSIVLAEPYLGEKAFVISAGLTDKFSYKEMDTASENNYKKHFGTSSKEIIYWATVETKTKGLDTLQTVEWFSPTGELWLSQTRKYLGEADPFQGSDICQKYELPTSDIPTGVWMVRFIWNDNNIEHRYFSFGDSNSLSDTKIEELKNKVSSFDKSMKLSNKGEYLLKVNSALSLESKDVLRKQKIFKPNYSFSPDEELVYTLNVYGGKLVLGPNVYVYLFSPSGMLYDNEKIWVNRDRGPDYFAMFKRKIKVDDKSSDNPIGLWKLVAYYVDNDQILDERYFYIGKERKEISQKDIDVLEGRIKNEDLYNALYAQDKRVVDEWRKLHKNQFIGIIKNGMTKEYILNLLGQPDKIDNKLYDDAEVWVYQDVEKSVANAIKDSGANYQILHGTGNVGHDLVGGAIYTIISAGIGAISTNKLELVMKDGKVVGKRGSI